MLAVDPTKLDWNPVGNDNGRREVYGHPYAVRHFVAGFDGAADRGPRLGGRLLVRVERKAIAFRKLFRQLDFVLRLDPSHKLPVVW